MFDKRRSLYLFKAYSYGLTLDRLRLYYKDFANIIMGSPNVKEQTKIASFLSSIDRKIELITKELNSLKQFKKALLQKMFV